jgi:hypothetical protein
MNTHQRHKDIIMRILSALSAVVLSAGLLALFGCGEDKPTQPSEPKDYLVYFADQMSVNHYFRYQTGTGIIDSFTLPYDSWESGFGISPDGKTMYLNPDGYIVKVSLDSHVVIAENPVDIELPHISRPRSIIVSPDGQYMAINRYDLYLLNVSDFSVVYHDTNETLNGRFAKNGDVFVCSGYDSIGGYALQIDMTNGFAETKWRFASGGSLHVIPDADYKRFFLYLHVYTDSFLFQAYDIASDSVIFSKSLCPGLGDMEITSDGRYIIFSQTGSWTHGCPPPRYFTIFDIEHNCIDREVDAFIDSLGIAPAIGELCLTPDGRHLIGIGPGFEGWFFDYDIQRHEFDRQEVLRGTRSMFSLACQSNR